jgi:ubiquinone/menaquinone biosynthesis C-methylase UbiE
MMSSQEVRDAWDMLATGYDERITPDNMTFAEGHLRRIGLQPGMRFLDVAAGTGGLSIPAARLGARVLGVDISPAMIERLTERARKEGLSNVEGRVMDGQALDLEDDTFDIAGSQAGIMLFPDLPRGLSEMVRVTKPGGRVLVVAFGSPTNVEFITFFIGAMRTAISGFKGFPMDSPPLPFQVADPEVLRRRMVEAGLTDVRVETVTHDLEFESGKQLWDYATNSNPIGAMMVAGLTDGQSDSVRQVLDGMLAKRSGGGPAVLNSEINIGIGTK